MNENESMKQVISEIKEITKKQKSASKVDEIRVMKSMINDPDFVISIYDRNKGLIGTRCPHDEAVKFAVNICTGITGIDQKSAATLADNYEFTKKDAIFLIENSRDFTETYLSTGRKLPIMQSNDSEASLFIRPIEAKEKTVPLADGTKQVKKVLPFNKVICKSKNPKYNN